MIAKNTRVKRALIVILLMSISIVAYIGALPAPTLADGGCCGCGSTQPMSYTGPPPPPPPPPPSPLPPLSIDPATLATFTVEVGPGWTGGGGGGVRGGGGGIIRMR